MRVLVLHLIVAFLVIATAAVTELDEAGFEAAVTKPGWVLVDFYAPWCGHCQALAPELDRLSSELPELSIVKIDADKFRRIANKQKIDAYPTLKLFKDGTPIRYEGSYKADHMLPRLKRMMAPEVMHFQSLAALEEFMQHAGSDLPVFIVFCTKEHEQSRIIEDLASNHKLRAWFLMVEPDSVSEEALVAYGVTQTPALLVYHANGEGKRLSYDSGADLAAFVKRNLLPPVTHLSPHNIDHVKEDGRPVFLWISDEGSSSKLKDLAIQHSDYVFAVVNSSAWPTFSQLFHSDAKMIIWTGGFEYYTSASSETSLGQASNLLNDFEQGRAKKSFTRQPSLMEQLTSFIGQNIMYVILFFVGVVVILQGMDWRKPDQHE